MLDRQIITSNKKISYEGLGVTSKQLVKMEIYRYQQGSGIIFRILDRATNKWIDTPASCNYVVNTLRNVTIGQNSVRLSIVEHFLAAAALYKFNDLLVCIDGAELPLDDGSAKVWIDLFKASNWQSDTVECNLELKEPIVLNKGDRTLIAVPSEIFTVSYLMDWNHPAIGKRWYSWSSKNDIKEIALARTFSMEAENKMLGVDNIVGLTDKGFNRDLHFPDEPVRHKVLDLIGDLMLAGINPLYWKAHFISIKGGHEIDVEMAKQLALFIKNNCLF